MQVENVTVECKECGRGVWYPDERSIYAGRECDCGVQGVW